MKPIKKFSAEMNQPKSILESLDSKALDELIKGMGFKDVHELKREKNLLSKLEALLKEVNPKQNISEDDAEEIEDGIKKKGEPKSLEDVTGEKEPETPVGKPEEIEEDEKSEDKEETEEESDEDEMKGSKDKVEVEVEDSTKGKDSSDKVEVEVEVEDEDEAEEESAQTPKATRKIMTFEDFIQEETKTVNKNVNYRDDEDEEDEAVPVADSEVININIEDEEEDKTVVKETGSSDKRVIVSFNQFVSESYLSEEADNGPYVVTEGFERSAVQKALKDSGYDLKQSEFKLSSKKKSGAVFYYLNGEIIGNNDYGYDKLVQKATERIKEDPKKYGLSESVVTEAKNKFKITDFPEGSKILFNDGEEWIVIKKGMRGSGSWRNSDEITIKPFNKLAKDKNISLPIDINLEFLNANTKSISESRVTEAKYKISLSDFYEKNIDKHRSEKSFINAATKIGFKESDVKSLLDNVEQGGDSYAALSKDIFNESRVTESHFEVGDTVEMSHGGTGVIVSLDKEDGAEDEKYYNVKLPNGDMHKHAPNELTKVMTPIAEGKTTVVIPYNTDKDDLIYVSTILKKAGIKAKVLAGIDSEEVEVTIEKSDLKKAAKALSANGLELQESVVTEAKEIKSDEQFKEYAFAILQKAFGDEFDEAKAQEVVDGLTSKYSGDYGAMVGALQSSMGS